MLIRQPGKNRRSHVLVGNGVSYLFVLHQKR